jgi:hypothetical protein
MMRRKSRQQFPQALSGSNVFPYAGHGVYRDQPESFFQILRDVIIS